MQGVRPAVFLDRDGVINENLDGSYVQAWEAFRFLPGAIEAIAALTRAGFPIVVVTNQAGIGKGLMAEETVMDLHRRMLAAIEAGGGSVDAVLYCPHRVEDGCACRKPQPGLFRRAAAQLGLDLARSVFVGDAVSDVQAALAAGCRPILVRTGRGRAAQAQLAGAAGYEGVAVVEDLGAAAVLIAGDPSSASSASRAGRAS
jgi:D-glycero-D-manno-heptose 1,7-bisphosphate phosphatase